MWNIDHVTFANDLATYLTNFDLTLDSHPNFLDLLTTYNHALKSCIDLHAPLYESKPKNFSRPAWMDGEYILARAKRRRLYKIYKRHLSPSDYENYSVQRNICSTLVETKKKHYFNNIITSTLNQKSFYQIYNKLLDKQNNHILPDHDSDVVLATNFNKFFIGKIKNIHLAIDSSAQVISAVRLPVSSCEPLNSFDFVTDSDIRIILTDFGIKSSITDSLPSSLMSHNKELLIPYLTNLVNTSLMNASMDGLKEAVVTPILKNHKLDPNSMSNYRPISNLPFVSKLIERVVLKQLNFHMLNNNLLSDDQFGYKKFHSTETLLLKLVSDTYNAIDKDFGIVVICIDFSAAFDTVDHNKLLSILEYDFNIGGSALNWFRSYFSNRSQKVKINDSFSPDLSLDEGVPQGSILGPTCYNIYASSIKSIFTKHGFSSLGYADDNEGSSIFTSYFQNEMLLEKTANLLADLHSWANSMQLKLNPDKTEVIIFGSKTFLDKINLVGFFTSDSTCIKFTDSIKHLGFHLDNLLNLNLQINNLVSSCYLYLRHIRSIRKYITQDNCAQLIHSFITSRLDYCNSLYIGLPKNLIAKLQKVQNAAVRVVVNKRKCQSVQNDLIELHWLNIEKRIVFKALLIIFNCLNGTAPIVLSMLLSTKSNDDLSTHYRKLKVNFYVATKLGHKSFAFYAPNFGIISLDI